MEKIQENICKQACSYVFVQENYIKAHVLMYFLHLVLTFTPHYIIMVKEGTARQQYILCMFATTNSTVVVEFFLVAQ